MADDTEGSAKLMKRMLELDYSSVEVVEDGQLLMQKLLNPDNKYDFIVTDYEMPNMNGLDVLKQIRATEHLKHLPVIMLSGVLEYQDLKKEVESLGGVFMSRPVDISQLHQTIERMRQKKE